MKEAAPRSTELSQRFLGKEVSVEVRKATTRILIDDQMSRSVIGKIRPGTGE
jgi:hypothetical protein